MIAIDTENVKTRFAALAGVDAADYETLCSDAALEIQRMQKSGCGPEASGPLAAAAAALAFYRFVLAGACVPGGSFEAGDLKVSPEKPDVPSARRFWRESLAAAAPYLEDTCFLFRRTSV
jgi:hypothetical protein